MGLLALAMITAAPGITEAQTRCSAAPPVVQNARVVAGATAATISWDALAEADAVGSYTVSFAATADGDALTTIGVGLTRSFAVVLPTGEHFLRVRATNACGTGPFSTGISVRRATPTSCTNAPNAARNLRGRVESGSLIWTWDAPIGGDRPDDYELEIGSWPGGSDIGTYAVNGFSHVTSSNPLELHARVRAQNTCGVAAPSDDARSAGAARTYERATVDRPDDGGGYEIKIMYVIPRDRPDLHLDVNGTLVRSVAAARKWFERQAGRSYRIDTFNGVPDIGFVQMSKSDDEVAARVQFVRDEVEAFIKPLGFNNPRKIYMVFYDGTSTWACGGGAFPPTLIGSVAAIYLNGLPTATNPCRSSQFTASIDAVAYKEFSALHEILHNWGYVAACAVNNTRSAHTSDDRRDLMYAGDLGWQPSLLDVNRDDYFAHGRNCLDLSQSVFLTPADVSAVRPPGWTVAADPLQAMMPTESQVHVCRMMPDGARPQ